MYDKLKIDKIVPVYYIISGQKRQSPVQVSDIVIDQAAAAGPAQHAAPVAGQQQTDTCGPGTQELRKLVLQSSRLELSFQYLNDSYCANRSKIFLYMMWCNGQQ